MSHLASTLRTATTSDDAERPANSHQRRPSGTMMLRTGAKGASGLAMTREVRTDPAHDNAVTSVQSRGILQRIRKCTTRAQCDVLAALATVPEPLTPARIVQCLPEWSEREARRWIDELSARGYLRSTGRGYVWTCEEARTA